MTTSARARTSTSSSRRREQDADPAPIGATVRRSCADRLAGRAAGTASTPGRTVTSCTGDVQVMSATSAPENAGLAATSRPSTTSTAMASPTRPAPRAAAARAGHLPAERRARRQNRPGEPLTSPAPPVRRPRPHRPARRRARPPRRPRTPPRPVDARRSFVPGGQWPARATTSPPTSAGQAGRRAEQLRRRPAAGPARAAPRPTGRPPTPATATGPPAERRRDGTGGLLHQVGRAALGALAPDAARPVPTAAATASSTWAATDPRQDLRPPACGA